MKAPLCEICAKTGVLCPSCESKLSKGEITELDVKVSRILYEMAKEHPIIDKITFLRAFQGRRIIVLMVEKGDVGPLVGRGGRIVRELSRKLKKEKVRIVGKREMKQMIQDLIIPARLLGVNVLYLPGGKEKYRVRIPKEDRKKIPAQKEELEKIMREMFSSEFEIRFE